jgi:hypothetical protein
MLRRTQQLVLVLAVAAIAVLAFATPADLLPHHHDNINERGCPICNPPFMGLQPAALKLPLRSAPSWSVHVFAFFSIVASPVCLASPRAPPAV